MKSVLFVCLGNICRSPTAHGVFLKKVANAELSDQIKIDSCGTGNWHTGHAPDSRSTKEAAKHGYDLSMLEARKLSPEDFTAFDYIIAMDTRNLADVIKIAPSDFAGQIKLLLDYAPELELLEVPDPYHGGEEGFKRVLSMVEVACDGLLTQLKKELNT